MNNLLIIGLGGFFGAVLRYLVSGAVQDWFRNVHFPYGTLVVNIIGCLLIGLFTTVAESRGLFSAQVRSFIFIGLLGAFTTFSTFSNDTLGLIRGSANTMALMNVTMHLVFGLAAVWMGGVLGRTFWS